MGFIAEDLSTVFPARAGMSPDNLHKAHRQVGVPRASGDEPVGANNNSPNVECSPRERG